MEAEFWTKKRKVLLMTAVYYFILGLLVGFAAWGL